MKQLSEAKRLIKEQADAIRVEWQKTIGKRIDARSEKYKVLLSHFADVSNDDREPCHHIDFCNKNLPTIQKTEERMVYVLVKSGAFSLEEVSFGMKKRNISTIKRIFVRVQSALPHA